jgi:hypothetical protein
MRVAERATLTGQNRSREKLSMIRTLRESAIVRSAKLLAGSIAAAALVGVTWRQGEKSVEPELEGSWRVTVTPDDGRPAAFAYHSFARGGAFLESNTLGTTVGHGVWERQGANTFGFTFEKFVFTPAGSLVGRAVIREVLELDGSGRFYTGRAQVQILNLAGHRLDGFCARTQAERIGRLAPECQ